MKMVLALFASLLAGVSFASVIAAHAEVKPGCIGGCMGSAIAAPTPVFPVGYECKANWPLASVAVPCVAVAGRESQFTISYVTHTVTNPDGSKSSVTSRERH